MNAIAIALEAPNSPVLIRPVQLTDTDDLCTYCWPGRSFMTVHNLVRRINQCLTEKRGLGVVGVGADGLVCGYGQVIMWPTCAEISDMIVAEAYRGQGLGTALIQTLVREASRMGVDEVEIGAAHNNPRAGILYRRLGFRESHTIMLNLDGAKEKVTFLRLTLREPSPQTEQD